MMLKNLLCNPELFITKQASRHPVIAGRAAPPFPRFGSRGFRGSASVEGKIVFLVTPLIGLQKGS